MNPAQRAANWSQGASAAGSQSTTDQTIRQSTPGTSSGAQQASGPFFSNQPNRNLPSLAGISQAAQTAQEQTRQQTPGAAPAQAQGGAYSLPGISQALPPQASGPLNAEQESRDVEMAGTEEPKREQDASSHGEATAPTHAANVTIQQPLPLPPNIRSIHAPDGLLGNPGPILGPGPLGPSVGGPSALAGMFPGSVIQQQQHHHSAPQLLMPLPSGGPPGQMGMGQAGQQPILNDALSYLDQVKVQFSERPDVYNQFLDIMKDFKSGAIDTPGVIDRVSNLFTGNPNLIQGFNTFLPPGYKIECGTGDDPNSIRVTTPQGSTVRQMPSARALTPGQTGVNGNNAGYYDGPPRSATSNWQQNLQPGDTYSADGRNAAFGGQPISPEAQATQAAASTMIGQHDQRGVNQLQNAVSAATGGARQGLLSPPDVSSTPLAGQALNGMPGAQAGVQHLGAEKRGPVEFNHAISYVNKIKNRFAAQPDIYKQFLEILQTYQRESKPIQDVYAQVTKLFEAAPDLLEDFKQFLPESAAHAKAQAQQRMMGGQEYMISDMRNDPGYAAAAQMSMNTLQQQATPARLPPLGTFSATPTTARENKRKRPRDTNANATVRETVPAPVEASNVRGQGNGKRPKQPVANKPTEQPAQPPVSPTLVPSLPTPIPPQQSGSATQDDMALFDRIKKHINNKNSYSEFLKLCNLYAQELISKDLMVHRAHSFLAGNPELYQTWKLFIGYDGSSDDALILNPKTSDLRVALSKCRSLHSYRMLPRIEAEALCSGRDDLCKQVLNDDWASHPTWASEDSGFVAHRKNMHEEGLHRIEEERHDYDHNIEALLRTIQLLEPIAQQLKAKAPAERHTLKVPERLGGQSDTIYRRVIMKIYGREKGQTVVRNLYEQPDQVIPIVLSRLKTKLEEWKAAQREWEKVWRDQTQKIFWRSLDHQSAGTRASDKRQFQPKNIQNEIQVKYEEQRRLAETGVSPMSAFQFEYQFNDTDVLLDAAELTFVYIDHHHSSDATSIKKFIKEFMALFFGLDPAQLEQRIRQATGSDDDMDVDTPNSAGGFSPKVRANGTSKGLLRGVLDRGKNGSRSGANSVSRATTPDNASIVNDDMHGVNSLNSPPEEAASPDSDRWLKMPKTGHTYRKAEITPDEPYRRKEYTMYANLSIYIFWRALVMFYERLLELKQHESHVAEAVRRAKHHTEPAQRMNMIDRLPDNFFTNTSPSANYYEQVLRMMEEQIRENTAGGDVEEVLRRFYLQVGWKLYSYDKLLGSLVRFASGVINPEGKDKSKEIYQLFKTDRVKEETTRREEVTYRKQIENRIKDGEMYRITFSPRSMRATTNILKSNDPTFDPLKLHAVDRWNAYLSTYTLPAPTEGINPASVVQPFLHRGVKRAREEDEEEFDQRIYTVKNDESITIRIGPDDYRIRFEPNSIETIYTSKRMRYEGTDGRKTLDDEAVARGDVANEKLVMNNSWMVDMSRDKVLEFFRTFKDSIENDPGAMEE